MSDLDFRIGWSGAAATRGFSQLASEVKHAGAGFKSLESEAEAAGRAVKKAQGDAAAATRKVAVEEQKLKELRDSGKAKLSQILAAEDRVANARRRSAAATEAVEHAAKDLERAEKGLAEAQSKSHETVSRSSAMFGALGRGAEHARKGVGAAGKGLAIFGAAAAGVGVAGVAAFGAVGAAGLVMGGKVASGNEQAKISFTTMLGSAKRADAFLRDLQKFAAETPFEFPELQTAASSLISAGVNANKVIPIMRTLGDVTSGMGTGSEGVQRATIALQQMQAAGRITAEDLNQLRDAGIPVFDLLAAATGKSKAKIVELAQAGKLGKKELGELMKALESGKGLERFNGLMEAQSHSLAGMWSTLKDTIGQGLGGLMDNAMPLMKSALAGISTVATGAFGWVDKNKASISGLAGVVSSSFKSIGRIISATFGAIISSTGDGTKTFRTFADFVETHQSSIVAGYVAVGKASLYIGKGLAISASAGLRGLAAIVGGLGTVRGAINDMFGAVLASASKAFSWVPELGPKLAAASSDFASFNSQFKDSTGKAANGMRALADGIDHKLVPGIDKGAAALDKFGRKELVKAKQRDQLAQLSIALRSIPKEKRAEIRAIAKTKGVGEAMKEIAKVKGKTAKIHVESNAKGVASVSRAAINAVKGANPKIKTGSDAKAVSKAARDAIDKVKGKKVDINVNSDGVSMAGAVRRAINAIKGKTVHVNIIRHGNLAGANRADGGPLGFSGIAALAGGGPIRGVGGPREDNIAIMDRATGKQMAWGSNGEFMTNQRQYQRNKDQVETINAGGEWDLVPRRAAGGPLIRYERPVRYERMVGGGGGSTVINMPLHVHAPNYVGTPSDLVRALDRLEKTGALDTFKRRMLR